MSGLVLLRRCMAVQETVEDELMRLRECVRSTHAGRYLRRIDFTVTFGELNALVCGACAVLDAKVVPAYTGDTRSVSECAAVGLPMLTSADAYAYRDASRDALRHQIHRFPGGLKTQPGYLNCRIPKWGE